MQIFFVCIIGLLLGVVVWQLAVWSIEIWQKNRKYKAAVICSKKCGKPLLVAGGPWSNTGIRRWLNLPAHGSGDVCLDIARRAFEGHPRGLMADVTQIPFNDKVFGAVFASHLMEHLPSISSANRALDELNRVSEAVFIVCPSRQSVGAWLHRGHHLWVWQQGNTIYIKQRNGSRHEKTAEYVIIDAFSGVVTGPSRKI